jgi:hypothetical protein
VHVAAILTPEYKAGEHMPTDLGRIEAAVKEEYGSVEDFWAKLVIENFLQGSVYYCEFNYPEKEEGDKEKKRAEEQADDDDDEGEEDEMDDFCYVFANSQRVQLFDDGVEVLKGLQAILEKRRSFLQRLNEFSLVEMIGAVIALTVTLAFVILTIARAELNKEFMAIFAIIAGYYFGKNVGPAR